jgi:ATP-dependent DNA helicase UvrD/PcrA
LLLPEAQSRDLAVSSFKDKGLRLSMDLSSLTPSQSQVVTHKGGPLMVLAGPGTGKTLALTHRLAFLMDDRAVSPDQILALTFTHKAAEEMRSRIDLLFRENKPLSRPWITTFHGFCLRFLQEEVPTSFQLLSEQETLTLLKETVREEGTELSVSSLKELSRLISQAKNRMILPGSPEKLPFWETHPQWISWYGAFQKKLSVKAFWDFDELLIQAVLLLEKNPNLQKSVQARFPYLFVDEFQDINAVQYRLFRLLTLGEGEWMVIGDPNQAIYGFRGASPDFFSHLKRLCPALTKVQFMETFRLTQTILSAAYQALEGTSKKRAVPLSADRKGTPHIPLANLASAEEEGEYVARIIEEEMGGLSLLSKGGDSFPGSGQNISRSFADFGVLYRLHAQGEILAKALAKQGIPYKKIQEIPWTEQPEVRGCLRLLRSFPLTDIPPERAVEEVLSGENPNFQPTGPEGRKALRHLRLIASTFKGSLEEFIETLSLQTGLDWYEPDQETVKLLTLHAAKGLEFPVIIMTGCEANLLPLSLLKESDPEEERRLFFVGMTRAREKLFLTWAKRRFLFGQSLDQTPSPFIPDSEIILRVPVNLNNKAKLLGRPRNKQMSLF